VSKICYGENSARNASIILEECEENFNVDANKFIPQLPCLERQPLRSIIGFILREEDHDEGKPEQLLVTLHCAVDNSEVAKVLSVL
jgi:hypothetical protein